ncbi:MAG TPA: FkbM family methyltransferase [Gemmatimonadaceae bacterium]|nr:FkbM family methyltransferase [Gemmatimonadaceae bacterium]
MTPPLAEPVINALRPLQLKGKGFAFNLVTPRSGTRRVKVWGDYEMTLDLANAIHRQIYMGCFGRDMTVWTRTLLPTGGRFLDVGAHMGYFSLLASHCVGPSGRVHAVEPNPAAFSALRAHLTENRVPNVDAHNIALSDREGSLRLYVPPASSNRDYNVTMMPRPDWNAVDVPARPLDDCLREWGVERIDVMKVDVEGAEPLVFGGGAEHLRRGVVRHVVVEVNGPRLTEGGSSPARLFAQLDSYGFAPARLAGRRAVPVPPESLDTAPGSEYDRLFVHRSAS